MERVDKLVRQLFPGLTARQADEAIEWGWVRQASHPLSKGSRVENASVLDVSRLRSYLEKIRKGNALLEVPVLAEQEGLWVVDKPAGMRGHPLGLDQTDTVTDWALARSPTLAGEFAEFHPTVTPHRLDTGTSGVLLVARTRAVFDAWRERFKTKQVTKTYLAWCWGRAEKTRWECGKPIGRAKGKKVRYCENGQDARPAMSRIRVVTQKSDRFLAEIVCETGVTHQVRVHLASSGYPLIGDKSYDQEYERRIDQPAFHMLRATRLESRGEAFAAPTSQFQEKY